MKKLFLPVILVLGLTGCAVDDYAQYAKSQEAIAASKAQSDTARYKAMSDIAASGDSSAKVAAVMAMALSQGGGAAQSTMQAPAPNQALQWASILVPSLTQIYGIRANADVAKNSSDNAAATSIATTQGFVGIAGKIQAAGPSYVYGANSGANSGNSGRLAGTTMMDATSTPTVVLQPIPTVVTQPAPIVVTETSTTTTQSPPIITTTQSPPIVVTQPAPVIVNPVIVPTPAPVIINPVIVPAPDPVIVNPVIVPTAVTP